MNLNKATICLLIVLLASQLGSSEVFAVTPATDEQAAQGIARRHSIGSTIFLLGNLAPGDPPRFYLLNYRYQLSPRDLVYAEATTWTYYEPLGTYGASDEKYPGKVQAYGVGVGYQRFLWQQLYASAQATPFVQQFYNAADEHLQNGWQLYLQLRLGYRIELFQHRWFIEPSLACNYWPVNTNFPAAFQAVEDDAPDYYLFEPGLHFGYKF
jgi:hypothetical protein